MEEKVMRNLTESQFKKERFSFELRINDNIVCQRYFRINGFKNKSLYSNELKNVLNYCVSLIKDNLASKSRIYNWYTAPQVFKNKEEMDRLSSSDLCNLSIPSYIVLEDCEDVYVWDGNKSDKYEDFFNRYDYVGSQEVTKSVLKFSFLDNEKEIYSQVWDANEYPKFIRTNIDISNSKNKYKANDNFSPFEFAMVEILNAGKEDLIPIIAKEICVCCSYDNDKEYTVSETYGNKKYNFKVNDEWNNYVYSLEKKLKNKTDKYFDRWSE